MNDEGNEDLCSTCGGTGEITTMETVYAGEPHTAPIGTARCPDCNAPDEAEYEPEYDDEVEDEQTISN